MSIWSSLKDRIKSSFLFRGRILQQQLLVELIRELQRRGDQTVLDRQADARRSEQLKLDLTEMERRIEHYNRCKQLQEEQSKLDGEFAKLTELQQEMAGNISQREAIVQENRYLKNVVRSYHPITLADDREILSANPLQTIRKVYVFQENPAASKLCLFAHYDKHGWIDPCVLFYLEELKKCGFDICLISTSPTLDEAMASRVKNLCSLVIHRENTGLDFGSWRCALEKLGHGIARYDGLLLANDSVFGPLSPLPGIFAAMDSSPADIVGLTENWEFSYHLQSYFLYFKKNVIEDAAFNEFWRQVVFCPQKEEIIDRYELGLSKFFIMKGFQLSSLTSYYEVKKQALLAGQLSPQLVANLKSPQNPTLVLWDVLIEHFNFPFVKGELLKINPHDADNVMLWRDKLPKASPIIPLIVDYLKRTQMNSKAV